MKILLLEDDFLLKKHIEKYFTLKGHEIIAFDDGLHMLDDVNLYDFDFYIFDINVPNVDGFEVLEFLREKKIDFPVIMISAMVDINNVKKAYALGCSDYLKKPFELAELELRMDAIMKSFHFKDYIEFQNGYKYDLIEKQLFKGKKTIILSKKQNEILYLLIKNIGRVLSFDTIADFIYEDAFKDMHTISSHIRDIRKHIDFELIKNVRGVGYIIKK
ncbi:MAG: DNA-binding response regulator [Arcobacter sp.]|nr:MAG: DNA-binding response regulator [Arcobacter sp.]